MSEIQVLDTPPEVTKRNLILDKQRASIKTAAESKSMLCKKLFRDGAVKSWTQLGGLAGVVIPTQFQSKDFNYLNLNAFSLVYAHTAVEEWEKSFVVDDTRVVETRKHSLTTGTVTLTNQQRKATDEIISTLLDNPDVGAMLLPLEPGKGKSYVAAAVTKYLQDRNFPGQRGMYLKGYIHVLTPKTVVEKTRRTFAEKFGITKMGLDVRILTVSEYTTKLWSLYFKERTEILFGNPVTRYDWNLGEPPLLIIVDECHLFKKEEVKKARRLRAFLGKSKMLFTSATPGVTIKDMKLFSLATGIKVAGKPLDDHTWPPFAQQFTLGADISYPNAEAMKRWTKAFSFYISRPPNDPQKVKVYNHINLLEFRTDRERTFYREAEQRWIEANERIGKSLIDTRRAAFTIFRHDEEILKTPYMIERMMEAYGRGMSPIGAFCFQDAVRDGVLLLTEKYGIPRDNIALVWGGARKISEADIYTQDELSAMITRITQVALGEANKESISKAELSKFRKSISYTNDMVRRHETEDEKRIREDKLSRLNLHAQTIEERQRNIDEYQSGKREFCLYSFAAGGVGIDLDQQVPATRPRHLEATICYYAEEIVQALRRTLRVATLSDVHQYINFFAGTIAANHVAPRLATKLRSMGHISSAAFDLVSDMESDIEKGKIHIPVDEPIPSVTEAIEDAAAEDAELDSEVDEDNDDDKD